MEQMLVYGGAELLEIGDDHWKNAAVDNELHEQLLRSAQVCRDYWCEDWLV